MSTNVSVIIREIHRADVPGNTHYIASVQLLDGEDGWVSPAFPVDFHDKHELERKIAQEVIMYIMAKQNLGKHIARGRWL